jgi:hypothetical protein
VDDETAVEQWLRSFGSEWHAREDIEQFRAFVARRLDDVDVDDVVRFRAALVTQGVGPSVQRRIIERAKSLLWLSRWQPVGLECPCCEEYGWVHSSRVRATRGWIYSCFECDSCWESPRLLTSLPPDEQPSDRLYTLQWWELANNPDR